MLVIGQASGVNAAAAGHLAKQFANIRKFYSNR